MPAPPDACAVRCNHVGPVLSHPQVVEPKDWLQRLCPVRWGHQSELHKSQAWSRERCGLGCVFSLPGNEVGNVWLDPAVVSALLL